MVIVRRVALIAGLIASIILSPVIAAAQGTSNDWGALRNLPSNSKIAVKLKTGKKVEGQLSAVSDSGLTVFSKGSSVELKRDEISTVHQVTRKSATPATLIGMGIGAGAGAGLGAIAIANDDSGFDKIDKAATAGLAVIGAGVGAVTGYLVGRSATKRVLVYESK